MAVLDLTEWQQVTPEDTPVLRGLSLGMEAHERSLFERLDRERIVKVRELRSGLAISTTSYVGTLRIGSLVVSIRPKLDGRPFSILLGYALGLSELRLLPEQEVELSFPSFQDLLIDCLSREAVLVISRGLYRHYAPQQRALISPRGRILFRSLARDPSETTATLPCLYHERDQDILPNRVLLAGLQLGARLALDSRVRTRALRTGAVLSETVRPIRLDVSTFRALRRSTSRLTRSYEPAFQLIRLLLAGCGISASPLGESIQLPGFLFDMNWLFQQALGRFLRDSLDDVHVQEQYRLTEIFRYQPLYNPRRKQNPTPRPDYVMSRSGHVIAIADAKYRDLWETDLPREMLYQLSVYALSQEKCNAAAILYPSGAMAAREARISISDPVTGTKRGEVCLRPVHLARLAGVIAARRTPSNERERREFAWYMAHGQLTTVTEGRR